MSQISGGVAERLTEAYARHHDVCVRPIVREVLDRETGQVEQLVIPCQSTRASVCGPCAEKAKRLRMHQCAEGWHLAEDPLPAESIEQDRADEPEHGNSESANRRVRSTRRRRDVPRLPRIPTEDRTVGRTFVGRDGREYRPSMFVTLTMPSYGKIVPGKGCPRRPERYDYRRAAVEALLFSRLFDRWMQNLRRCAGYKVQYFGVIEPQRRLAPHMHLALRGAIPREVIRQVTRATYLQVWWPSFDEPIYVDAVPWWDHQQQCYRAPDTGERLRTWEEAVDDLVEPAADLEFGDQVDIKGIVAPSARSGT